MKARRNTEAKKLMKKGRKEERELQKRGRSDKEGRRKEGGGGGYLPGLRVEHVFLK